MFTVKNLSSGYGQSIVIRDLSLELRQNEILVIMGRNGMGKTTLLKTLIGILPTKTGSISLENTELAKLSSFDRVRQGIAYVPQGRQIFPSLTVMENMLTGARGDVERDEWEEIFSLFPVLSEMRSRKGGNLSGGQQQQLAIARALREIRTLRNLSIIVTEQVVSFMMDVCDRALVIERGRFVHEAERANLDSDKVKQLLAV